MLAPNENLKLHSNIIYRKLEGLIPTPKPFNGTKSIKLPLHFTELRHGFDALNVPESAAGRGLHFLLEGEAKAFYESFAARGTLSATRCSEFT